MNNNLRHKTFCLPHVLKPFQQIQFSEDDLENPRAWSKRNKLANVAVIASMASKQCQQRILYS